MGEMIVDDPAPGEPQPTSVFLNFPYDLQFAPLYLAYISGVCSFGLTPRVALETARGRTTLGSNNRTDPQLPVFVSRSFARGTRPSPSADAPYEYDFFELGLTVMASYRNPKQHTRCIFEKNLPPRSKVFRRPRPLGRV